MTVVAWVSRHRPLPIQIRKLKEKFGDIELVILNRTFRDVRDIYSDIKAVNAQYAVLVLPLSMISALVQLYKDVVWLWAEMVPVHEHCIGEDCPDFNAESDVIMHSPDAVRHLRFNEFRRILRVEMITEPF